MSERVDFEKYMIPANEGSLQTAAMISGGISMALGIAAKAMSIVGNKKHAQRVDSMSPEQMESREIFKSDYLPKINDLLKMINDDIDRINPQLGIRECLIPNDEVTMPKIYDAYSFLLVTINTNKFATPLTGTIGRKAAVELRQKLSALKPYASKWKAAAKKISPYLELYVDSGDFKGVTVSEDNISNTRATMVFLNFDYTDKDGIIKPDLPRLK